MSTNKLEAKAKWIMQNAGGLQNRNELEAEILKALRQARDEGLEEAARIVDQNQMSAWGMAEAIRATKVNT